jgi:hypothetical protein
MVDQEGMNHSFGFNSMSNMQSNQVLGGDENDGNKTNNHFHSSETLNLPHDISVMNFMQQFNYSYNQQQNRIKNDETFSEEYHGSFLHDLENNNILKSNTEEENDNKSLMTDNNQYMFVAGVQVQPENNNHNNVGKSEHGFHVGNGYVSKQKQEDVGTVTDKQTQQMEVPN